MNIPLTFLDVIPVSLSQICSLARVKMIVHFSLGANQEKEGKKTCSMLTFFDSKLVPNVTPTPANDNRHKSSFRTFVKTKIVFEYIRGSHTQACGRTVLMCSKAELAETVCRKNPMKVSFICTFIAKFHVNHNRLFTVSILHA